MLQRRKRCLHFVWSRMIFILYERTQNAHAWKRYAQKQCVSDVACRLHQPDFRPPITVLDKLNLEFEEALIESEDYHPTTFRYPNVKVR